MSRALPTLLVDDDPRHGVARLARQLAETVAALSDEPVRRGPATADEPMHVHFTDRLWGATPELAARHLQGLADGRQLTVTLHDVPQPSDGSSSLARRRRCYQAVVAASDGVVCCSEHERALLREVGILSPGDEPAVIPLPIILETGARATPPTVDEVALLGFVYPGKGHAEAIDAVAELPAPRPAVRALGAAAPGHEEDLVTLRRRAEARDVVFSATGWLTDAQLRNGCLAARVPLAAHAHVSASGSINSWIAAGRIPLVADSRYARELERLRPGTIRRYAPAALAETISAARDERALTQRPPGIDTRPHLDDIAARYMEWWASR